METVAFTNQKGGVAKTTSALHLATGLNNQGKRVLMVDLDPQTNLALSADVDLLNMETTLYNVFKDKADITQAIIPVKQGLDIIVGGLALASADMEFTRQGREYMLRECLEQIQGNYDYCVIDTSPSLGVMTMNALTASNKVVVPIQADVYSLQGTYQLQAFIETIQKYSNRNLVVDGLLITRHNERTVLTQVLQDQIENIANDMNTKVYDTKIRTTVEVGKSALMHSDLYETAPTATATKDYKQFVLEFLQA